MAYDLNNFYKRAEYEYLVRWSCVCSGAAHCEHCDGQGYFEEWLPLEEIFKSRPVTILDYRLAGLPSRRQPSSLKIVP